MTGTGITLIVVGVCSIVATIAVVIRRKKKYTASVTARCVEVIERFSPSEGRQRAGILEYEFAGEKHKVKGAYAKYGYPHEGDVREILLDPDNAEKFHDPQSNKGVGKTVIGFSISMIVIGFLMIMIPL